jgi:hypothetical protein
LDDLLKTVFPQPSDNPGTHYHPDYRDWCNLMSDLRHEMPIRNRLAHQPVGLWADVYQHDESKEIRIGPLLIGTSNSHAEALKKGKSDIPLRLEDIDAHTKRVGSPISSTPAGAEFRHLWQANTRSAPTEHPLLPFGRQSVRPTVRRRAATA